MKRSWFRFHLSTGLVLMLVTSGLLWLNMPRQPASESGQWVDEIKEKMKRKVSFCFVDDSFEDCAVFLGNVGNFNVVFDPEVTRSTPIFLVKIHENGRREEFHDVEIGWALQQLISKACRGEYTFRDHAIYIQNHKPWGFPFRFYDRSRTLSEAGSTEDYFITAYSNLALNMPIWILMLIVMAVAVEWPLRRRDRKRLAPE